MLPVSGHLTRHRDVTAKAEEAAGLLQDNHELQTFLQSCREVGMRQRLLALGVSPPAEP